MTREEANHLRSATRLRVAPSGIERHGLVVDDAEGDYVSQFDSPVHGRLVVVRLEGLGAYGFRLDELEVAAE